MNNWKEWSESFENTPKVDVFAVFMSFTPCYTMSVKESKQIVKEMKSKKVLPEYSLVKYIEKNFNTVIIP